MFDNSRPNVIILADLTDVLFMSKTVGPYKIASELRRAGFEVAVIHHLHIFDYSEIKNILSQLISVHTLYVGFNTIFYQNIQDPVLDMVSGGKQFRAKELGAMLPHGKIYNDDLRQHIKSCNPNCGIVIGGPDANDVEYLKHYDYVITGYADNSAVKLAQHLLDGTSLTSHYRSLFGFTVIADSRAEGYDFVNTPIRYEEHDCILPGETLVTEISRGCVFRCSFCSYPLNGKKKLDYVKNEEVLKQEFLDNWERFGVTRYVFADDTFNDSEEKIDMIYRISKSLPFNLEYWAYTRLDLLGAHLHTTDKLFESGLRGCFFGIETLNQRTGSIIGKSAKKEKLFETLKYIKQRWGNDVMLHGSFIFGLPHESVESLQSTIELLLSSNSPFDSYHGYPLGIYTNRTSQFSSEIESNYEKYGYKKLGVRGNLIVWENEHLNYDRAIEMVTYLNTEGQKNRSRKLNGLGSFNVANLGFDLAYTVNKPIADINWHEIDLRKQERRQLYKQQVYKQFKLS